MLLFLSLTGIILSVVLLYFNAPKYKPILYLGVFFFTVSLYGLNQYVILNSQSVLLISIFLTNFTFLSYLTGPALYWYIRSVLTDNSRFKKTDILHLIPSLLYFIAAIPYLLTPYSYKLEIATAIVNDFGFLGTYKFTFLSEIFPIYLVYLSRPLLVLVYTLWSAGLFIRYTMRHERKFVLSGQFFMTWWIAAFLSFQLLLILSHLFSIVETFTGASDVFFTVNALQLLSALGMIGLVCSPFFFPGILYGLPRIPDYIFKKGIKSE